MQAEEVTVVSVYLSGGGYIWDYSKHAYVRATKSSLTSQQLQEHRERYAHGADLFSVLFDPTEMVTVAEEIVKSTLSSKRG
jgi:hypothetical protein